MMNTTDERSAHDELPELSNEAIDRIEAGVFSEIADGRETKTARGRRRRRWIGSGVGAAAVIVAAIAIAPAFIPSGSGDYSASTDQDAGGAAPDVQAEDSASEGSDATSDASDVADADRMIIRNGSATIVVDDVLDASDAITALAAEHDGYVEGLGSNASGDDGAESGWATLRVPADDLDAVRSALGDIGEVTSTEISEDDVTGQAIDLRARIDATEASVDRLTELMRKAGSVSDLLEAETTLSERQAQLESYQRELDHLEGEVSMSTLSVSLVREGAPTEADPAGFGDGIAHGWSGLIVFGNGLLIAFGFLLPWLAAAGVAGLIVWAIVRLVRRRRRA